MHWLWTLWFGYTWPSLKGNGPEAVVQTVVYAAAAYLLVPPVREWMNGHMKSLHDKLDKHHEALLSQAEDHHDEHMKLIKKQHAETILAQSSKVTPIRKPRAPK